MSKPYVKSKISFVRSELGRKFLKRFDMKFTVKAYFGDFSEFSKAAGKIPAENDRKENKSPI